jgi:hypothetical protein
MLRLLLFLAHIAFSPHALHILISAHIYAYAGRSRGIRTRDLRGASPRGVRRSTSVKLLGTNIVFEQGKPRCIPQIILDFSFNHYLYAMLDCALSL